MTEIFYINNLPQKHTVLEQDQDKTIVKTENETGDAVFTIYKVFPGVEIIYESIHMDKYSIMPDIKEDMIVIHHCNEGRMEREFDNEFFYIGAGDLAVVRGKDTDYEFPLRHYHGLTIAIDTLVAPKCFSCFMKDVNIRPTAVADRLCGTKKCYVSRSEAYIEHIFSELYSVPQSIQKGYFKVKILELLLMLSSVEPVREEERKLSSEQVELAKGVKSYLYENMERHVTFSELAEHFYVSDSKIKTAFKGVYGVPVYAYMRIQKMQSAAMQLVHSERSITEIALDYGYDNASKFSAAFKDIMGETPTLYRREHKKY